MRLQLHLILRHPFLIPFVRHVFHPLLVLELRSLRTFTGSSSNLSWSVAIVRGA